MIDKWSFHFWNGLINHFPLCCIIFFCDSWTNNGEQNNGIYDKIIHNSLNWIDGDYIKCPECLITEQEIRVN